MNTPTSAVAFAVFGQGQNLSGLIRSTTTGNPLTGGLTGLVAYISKNDGQFVATTNAPVEILGNTGVGSGWYSLDLTAAELSFNKVLVEVRATNGQTDAREIVTLDLRPESVRYDLETVPRYERMALNVFSFLFNAQMVSEGAGGAQQIMNRDGFRFAQGAVQDGETTGSRAKLI